MKLSPHLCHDNDPTPCPHLVLELCIRLQMKSSAHTIFVMTTTLPHAPTMYWNYVLGYEIRHTDRFCCHDIDPHSTPPPPSPYQPLCIGIMYYVTTEIACSHYFCHGNDPTPCPHLVLELCIRLQMKSSAHTIFVMTTTLPHVPTLYWNYVLCYK